MLSRLASTSLRLHSLVLRPDSLQFCWGGGGWHKAAARGDLPLAAPIGPSPLLILTLCGPERVLVVSTEPPDDLSCLTTPGVGCPKASVFGCLPLTAPIGPSPLLCGRERVLFVCWGGGGGALCFHHLCAAALDSGSLKVAGNRKHLLIIATRGIARCRVAAPPPAGPSIPLPLQRATYRAPTRAPGHKCGPLSPCAAHAPQK